MQVKYKVIISVVVLAVAFASGRYSVNSSPNTKTTEVVKTNTQEQTDQNKHIVTVITKDCKTGKEVTTITEDDVVREKEAQKTVTDLLQTVTQQQRSKFNVSALADVDLTSAFKPSYGISIEREVIGPITAGVYGLTNGVIGISIGVNF